VWGSGGGGEDVAKTLGLLGLSAACIVPLAESLFRGLITNLSRLGAVRFYSPDKKHIVIIPFFSEVSSMMQIEHV
jgi:hypothetical protein